MKIRDFIVLAAFTAICLSGSVAAQTYTEGSSYYGRNSYIEYLAGGLPIIISVPHGGNEVPGEIPDRTCGTTVTDSYTLELSMEIRDAVKEITGRYPHVIINHLKRLKLDTNRDLYEATCGNAIAAISWEEYHKFIDSAKASVNRVYNKGLFVDLHGQSSHGERIELGYLLTGSQLALSDEVLNAGGYKEGSSIRSLSNNNVNNYTFAELLRGDKSMGTLLEDKGYTAVPSLYNESPQGAFFSGGYNTQRHGSVSDGAIDAIQIECNREIRFTESIRLVFAETLAVSLLYYIKQHYLPDLEDYYASGTAVNDNFLTPVSIYPNPVSDILHIRNNAPAAVQIVNLHGKTMLSRAIGLEEDLFVGNFPAGIYIIMVSQNGRIVSRQKIIVGKN